LEYKFEALGENSLELLEVDVRARMSYIDLLALMHDLLVPFATESERSRFTVEEVFHQLSNLAHAFPSESEIGIIARANIACAESLHSEFGRGGQKEPQKNRSRKPWKLQRVLDGFLLNLLKEYDLIRVISCRRKSFRRVVI